MYSPKILEDLIPKLYKLGKARKKPMTKIVNEILKNYLDEIEEYPIKEKIINQRDLTSDCWPIQIWGLPYCSGFGDPNNKCDYLATCECGGYDIRKKILSGEYPLNGLPYTDSYKK